MLLRFQYIPHSLLRPLLNHDSRVYQLSIHFLFEMRYQQHFDQTCSSTLYHWFSDLLEEHPHLTSCSKSSSQHRFVEVTRLYLCVTYLTNIQRKGVFPESFGIKWEPELIRNWTQSLKMMRIRKNYKCPFAEALWSAVVPNSSFRSTLNPCWTICWSVPNSPNLAIGMI